MTIGSVGPRGRAFLFLCEALARPCPRAVATWTDWQEVIAQANRHLVAPALWLRLEETKTAAALPADVRAYLSALYRVNHYRNRLARRVTLDAAEALNAAGLSPTVLKGGISLFNGTRPIGRRILTDVDLTVPEHAFAAAEAALTKAGFMRPGWRAYAPHAVTFYRPGDIVPIDLHRHIGMQREILSATAMAARARGVEVDGVRLSLPHPADRLTHGLLNSEVLASNQKLAWIALRHLLDLSELLSSPEAARIDWPTLERRFEEHGLYPALRRWLAVSHHLLHTPYLLAAAPGAGDRLHLWRAVHQMDRPWLWVASRAWAGMTHPLNRVRMDYLYGGPAGAGVGRLRHMTRLLSRDGLRALARACQQGEVT